MDDRLHEFQRTGVKFLIENRSALLADEVGVGKTPQVLVAAREVGAKSVLILCPASIKEDYRARCVKWGFGGETIHIITPQNVVRHQDKTGVFVVNYDICHRKEIARYLARKKYDVLICDESHYLKNSSARRTKAVFGAGGYASLAKYRWFMTGTPVLNRPEELYTTIKTLRPDLIDHCSDYISFTKRYCGGHQGPWGWVADGATNVQELTEKLHSFMLRRERDVLTELPEKIMNIVHLKRDPSMDALIYKEKEAQDSEVQTSIRQKIGLAKLKSIVQYVEDILESEEQIIVFAYHHSVIDGLVEALSEHVPYSITGKHDSKAKDRIVRGFISGASRVLILQIDAAGTGIDGLQDVCKHAIFAEISYVPGTNQQAMGRIHRNGQKHKVVFDFLTVEDSIDENLIEKNITKSDIIQEVMRDENKIFDFSKQSVTKTKEELMIESKVKVKIEFEMQFDGARLGKITSDLANSEGIAGVKASIDWEVLPNAQSAEPAPAKKTKRTEKVKETGAAANPADQVADAAFAPITQEVKPAPSLNPLLSYADTVKQAAGKIQQHVGKTAPEKINETLGELSARIKAAFPKYPHALAIQNPQEQNEVITVIETFMSEKGISRG